MQPLRLTLRTLLAYLDDTLEPAQTKVIGQKIAESEQARELIERIKQVTRRRRLTTPPVDGPGSKLDPNTVGEYLDNAVAGEQASEVEEICLASDVHLAEVAACHQILSLILGEPALVTTSAKQRMYGLVKGPEALPFRKPAASSSKGEIDLAESRDIDDTLRLGIPPVSGKHRGNPWIFVAGGAVAACLLILAVWQVLKNPSDPGEPRKGPDIAQVDPFKDKKDIVSEEKKDPKDPPEEKKEPKIEDKKDEKKDEKKDDKQPEVKVELPPVVPDVPFAPANNAVAPMGKFNFDPKDPGILMQAGDKGDWNRILINNPQVTSARALVSLPATTSRIQLNKGLSLTLVGNSPELFFVLPLYESAVELHVNDQLDLDFTLLRGRVRIASAGDKQARIRVRFENPTLSIHPEYFDLTLQGKGAEVLLDRWTYFTPGEKFFRNPKDPNRTGPTADVACVLLAGTASLKAGDLLMNMTAPPGNALATWNSRRGVAGPIDMAKLPDGLKTLAPLPQGFDPRVRKETLRARDDLSLNMANKSVDVVLAETVKSQDPSARRLATRSLGAVDDLSTLLDLLDQDKELDLRHTAIETLRQWVSTSRDSEYKLYEVLRAKYRGIVPEALMGMLHNYSPQDLTNPDTYEVLIGYLNHGQLAIRELAAWHLYQLVPAGQKIRYNAAGDVNDRLRAIGEWRRIIPAGQLPPMPAKK